MNNRHTALDGLRGFAALSVFLAHASFNIAVLTSIPIITILFSTLSVGTNAVQILFVLSGFLMAYLYSDIQRPFSFIRKRYTRIFPLYLVVVLFLWLTSMGIGIVWYQQLLILLAIVVIFHFGWRFIRALDIQNRTRTGIFIGFILLQISLIVFLILSKSHFDRLGHYPTILTGLSNLSLTTDFVSGIIRLNNPSWSLVPEVLFYITFPFIAIPLINLGKRKGILIGAILVVGMTKIVFDLDTAFYSFGNLQTINIARSSGFIAGIVAGMIYKSQGKLWKFFEKIFTNSLPGIFFFAIFLYLQWSVGNAIASGTSSIMDLNIYYLVSGWIIALVILAVIVPKTILNKIFSHKFFAFFGIISYSVYLIHPSILQIADVPTVFLQHYIPSIAFLSTFRIVFALTLTIIVAYLLFRFIESLYFMDKKHPISKEEKKISISTAKSSKSRLSILFSGSILVVLILFLYSGGYPTSLFVTRNSIPNTKSSEVSLQQHPLFIPFTSSYDNLSEVIVLLRYTNTSRLAMDQIKHHRQLVFHLYTEDKKTLLFTSTRDAWQVTGQNRFPFGFTPQLHSKNKTYLAEFSLEGNTNGEGIYVNTSPTSFISVYTYPQSKLRMLPTILINRIIFATSNLDAVFAILFVGFVTILELL